MTKSNNESRSVFRSIMKGTAIFGGSQAFVMFINILKGKLVAKILGALGMGTNSLFNSAIKPIQELFTFGLTTSAIRNIASEENPTRKAQQAKSLRRMLLILSLAGGVATISCSKWLSYSTFNDYDHTIHFMLLSIALFFMIMNTAETAILQGYRHLKALAFSNMTGPVCGLLFSVPLYYLFGVEGIVPSIIIMSLVSWCISRHFTRKLAIQNTSISWRESLTLGKSMAMLGATMMIAAVIGSVTSYLTNMFIRQYGSIDDVGFYEAANRITLQCTAMIFTALATDYYPHLSAVSHDKTKMQNMLQKEGEIVLLLIAPISALLILFAPIVVRTLLTSEFDKIIPVLRLIALSFIGRAICFPLDYVSLAKGDKTYYFWVEGIWCNVKTLALFTGCYYYFGYDGLGYAAITNAVTDVVVTFILIEHFYHLHYSSALFKTLIPIAIGCGLTFCSSFIENNIVSISAMTACATFVLYYSYAQLDKRIEIKELASKKIKQKFFKK